MAMHGWRQWLQVLAAVAIGVGIVAVGGYLLLSRSASPTPGGSQATPTQSTVELWDAYEQARAAAQGRLADATLVSASTQWQQPDEHMPWPERAIGRSCSIRQSKRVHSMWS